MCGDVQRDFAQTSSRAVNSEPSPNPPGVGLYCKGASAPPQHRNPPAAFWLHFACRCYPASRLRLIHVYCRPRTLYRGAAALRSREVCFMLSIGRVPCRKWGNERLAESIANTWSDCCQRGQISAIINYVIVDTILSCR